MPLFAVFYKNSTKHIFLFIWNTNRTGKTAHHWNMPHMFTILKNYHVHSTKSNNFSDISSNFCKFSYGASKHSHAYNQPPGRFDSVAYKGVFELKSEKSNFSCPKTIHATSRDGKAERYWN